MNKRALKAPDSHYTHSGFSGLHIKMQIVLHFSLSWIKIKAHTFHNNRQRPQAWYNVQYYKIGHKENNWTPVLVRVTDTKLATCLSRFLVLCIMQQDPWQNLMSPKTDDIWCHPDDWAQIQQRKSASYKLCWHRRCVPRDLRGCCYSACPGDRIWG